MIVIPKPSDVMLNRRGFLSIGLAVAVAPAVPLLAGCTSDADPPGSEDAAADGGRSGGTMRVAGRGDPNDRLSPVTVQGIADYVAIVHIWETLTELRGDRVDLHLAESIEPNADATRWTIRLRDRLALHDGRDLTADDLAYSLRTMATSPFFGGFIADIDVAGIRTVDDRTVEVPLGRPRADFIEACLSIGIPVFPDGLTDFTAGNGTGPFRLERYLPGEVTVLERNPDYWGGEVLLDGLEIRAIADPATRLNAVKSREIDYAIAVSPTSARAEEGNDDLAITSGGPANSNALLFAMNLEQPPFDDPDVRLACKLACDREALVGTVLSGRGSVGNDLLGKGFGGYAEQIQQREYDPDQAAALFASAGVASLTLRVAELFPGLVASAELYAQQLAAAGVTVTLDRADAATYFSDYAQVLSTPFQAIYYINRPAAAALPFATGSRASFDLTGFASPAYDALLEQAQASTDVDVRQTALVEAQQMVWEGGGWVVWGYQDQLDAMTPDVGGVELIQSLPTFGSATPD